MERFYNPKFLSGALIGVFLVGALFSIPLIATAHANLPVVLIATFAVGVAVMAVAINRARKHADFFAGILVGAAGVPLVLPVLYVLGIILHVDI